MTKYDSPRATWHVTTEGDCEGKSVKDLGVHHGFLHEIALALAPAACYGLQFKQVDTVGWAQSVPADSVHVQLAIDSKTWDMTPAERVTWFRKLLLGSGVSVSESNYYASVKLERPLDAATKQRLLAQSARSKLSRDELEALLKDKDTK
jgi:hypothetical protein